MTKVLIVEDEKELAEILVEYLAVEGFAATAAFDGEEGMTKFAELNPDIIILDIMLPKMNGIELCKKIREKSDALVIMLSARNGEMDKVVCFGAGADDYVTKPFSPVELIARVKAHIRRYAPKAADNKQGEKLELFPASYEAKICGEPLELTTKEFELLRYFAENVGRVFSKEQLYSAVWGENEYGDIGTVAVYIKRLRTKLEEYGLFRIKTVWGAGYKYVTDDGDAV